MYLYNTASRQIEEFKPMSPDKVGMYTCGPTVYNYAHIGNLRTYIFEDILKRTLLVKGYNVRHVMNITDVGHLTSDADTGDDKMEKGAAREGKTVWEIAEFYTDAFFYDYKKLNCLQPEIWCKATEHIEDQINLVKRLEEKGVTYKIDDGIYFDISKFPRYADFARLNLDKLRGGARVEVAEGKRNSVDFALWKFSPSDKKRQMEWDSPWGTGFPGWHIECSAMSMKYLGETFDIHCGGIDHINVHHTNEIAQAEAATGKTFVKHWVHGEFLVLDKGKMAKSGDKFLILQTLCDKGYHPLDYRYFCFSAHYRMPLTFSWEGLDSSKNALSGLRNRIREWKKETAPEFSKKAGSALKEFNSHAFNDLNMPNALAVLWTTVRNTSLKPGEKLAFLEKADEILGLSLMDTEQDILDKEIDDLIKERQHSRKEKNFQRADEIRSLLLDKGIVLEDTAEGVRWKRK